MQPRKLIQQEKLSLIGDIEGSTLFDGTTDVEVQMNLTKLKYIEHTEEIASNTRGFMKDLNLPEEFDASNCFIISCMYCISLSEANNKSSYSYLTNNDEVSLSINSENTLTIKCSLQSLDYTRWLHLKILLYKYL